MPSRWLRVAIVVFWLVMTGWLFWRDLWPNWRPGEPPPFYIDPVEEVQKNGTDKIFWKVKRRRPKEDNWNTVFRASTWIDYQREDDAYTLHARLDAPKMPPPEEKTAAVYAANMLKVERLTSEYRVTRSGHLLALEATAIATPDFDRFAPEISSLLSRFHKTPQKQGAQSVANRVSLRIWGEVHDGQFFAHCLTSSDSLAKPLQFDLPPTSVAHTGSVLLPLHPVNHIKGLRPGQRWRQPLVDPLRDALASLPGFSGGVRSLQARVLPQVELLIIDENSLNCFVVEYRNDDNDLVGRTWVEQDSDRVMQQEANLEDGQWIMTRDRSLFGPRLSTKR